MQMTCKWGCKWSWNNQLLITRLLRKKLYGVTNVSCAQSSGKVKTDATFSNGRQIIPALPVLRKTKINIHTPPPSIPISNFNFNLIPISNFNFNLIPISNFNFNFNLIPISNFNFNLIPIWFQFNSNLIQISNYDSNLIPILIPNFDSIPISNFDSKFWFYSHSIPFLIPNFDSITI